MGFTLPSFNVHGNAWNSPRPATGISDWINMDVQLYYAPKGVFNVQPGSAVYYAPPAWVRFSTGHYVDFINVWIWEIPAISGRFFRVRFKDKMHLGFPNEYAFHVVEQCDVNGNPIVRDVLPTVFVPASPGPPSPPHGASILMESTGYVLMEDGSRILLE